MAKSYLDKDGLLYFLQSIRPNATPQMDGTASTGSAKRFALQDHVHPSDTSKAPLASPAFSGTPTAPTATTGTSNTQIATTEFVANSIGAVTSGVSGVKGNEESTYRTGDVNLTPANIGAIATSAKGAANGVCPLNASSKIDTTYLPSYVDDVIEAYARSGATALTSSWLSTTSGGAALTPETGKIYVLMADSGDYSANSQFRWSGSAYVKLADGGVTSITNGEIDTIVAS